MGFYLTDRPTKKVVYAIVNTSFMHFSKYFTYLSGLLCIIPQSDVMENACE